MVRVMMQDRETGKARPDNDATVPSDECVPIFREGYNALTYWRPFRNLKKRVRNAAQNNGHLLTNIRSAERDSFVTFPIFYAHSIRNPAYWVMIITGGSNEVVYAYGPAIDPNYYKPQHSTGA